MREHEGRRQAVEESVWNSVELKRRALVVGRLGKNW